MKRTLNPLDVEELALHKTFQELTEEECTFVVQQLGSARAYNALRTTLRSVQQHLIEESDALQTRPDIRTHLLFALQEKHRKPPVLKLAMVWLRTLLAYRFPVWQAATMAIVALAAVVWLPQWERATTEKPPRVVYVRAAEHRAHIDEDSIVQRVVDSLKEELTQQIRIQVAKEYQIESNRMLLRDTAREIVTAVLKSMEIHESSGENNFVGLGNLPQLDIQKKGRTIAEDSSLSKFTVTAVSEQM